MKTLGVITVLLFSLEAFGYPYIQNKTRVSVVAGVSKTKLVLKEEKEITTVYTSYKPDFGLRLEKRVGKNLYIGFTGTNEQNAYISIGFDW